jgi:hemoglobin
MARYDDIGGAAAVRAALDAFYPRVLADEMLSPFFLGVDIERLKKTQESFIAAALGGPGDYAGRSLAHAHARTRRRGLNDAVLDRFLTIFNRVLIDLGLSSELLAVFEAARGQILQ